MEGSNTPESKSKVIPRDRVLNVVTISLFVVGVISFLYVIMSNYMKNRLIAKMGSFDCVKETTLFSANDDFMNGIVSKGGKVKVFKNFYNCNLPKREDLVLLRFSDQIEPVVRKIMGVPGDKYSVDEIPGKKGAWTITINDKIVKSNEEDFVIKSNTVPPLRTYQISRNGILKSDEYIVLSNTSPSISDSSNLGLFSKKVLAGRVVVE